MQDRLHARPCKLWLMATGGSTCCTACSLYSIVTTRNAMLPMHASRCNGSGCDYSNGLVSPTNPLTYDGRILQQQWSNECGASHTGDAVPALAETPAPASPATMRRSSSSSTMSSTSTVTLEAGVVITDTDKKGIRLGIRRSQRVSSQQHQLKRVSASGPRPAY